MLNNKLKEFLRGTKYKNLYKKYAEVEDIIEDINQLKEDTARYCIKLLSYFSPSKRHVTDIEIPDEYSSKHFIVFNKGGIAQKYDWSTNSSHMSGYTFGNNFIIMGKEDKTFNEALNVMKDITERCHEYLTKRKAELTGGIFSSLIELNIMLRYFNSVVLSINVNKSSGLLKEEDNVSKFETVIVNNVSVKNPICEISHYAMIDVKDSANIMDGLSFRDVITDLKYIPLLYTTIDDLDMLMDEYKKLAERAKNFYKAWFVRFQKEFDKYLIAKIV